jgi:hypothetical protein
MTASTERGGTNDSKMSEACVVHGSNISDTCVPPHNAAVRWDAQKLVSKAPEDGAFDIAAESATGRLEICRAERTLSPFGMGLGFLLARVGREVKTPRLDTEELRVLEGQKRRVAVEVQAGGNEGRSAFRAGRTVRRRLESHELLVWERGSSWRLADERGAVLAGIFVGELPRRRRLRLERAGRGRRAEQGR